ncbi:hypothetical protein [Roseovarius aestuariivivens]|uniref:hypothetical protein n=1 Tax=Roseovarius aestuariivivens TaxID=1888910 RepID=UPI001AEC2507|nr:hypothetical protein [Roseovarius aestuariivivens]
MTLRVGVFAGLALALLSGCAAETVWAPDDAVAKAAYRHDGPPRLTLYTMINRASGKGGHSSLMINGSQRVIFDPAGSFQHETIPERNDVVFGITPMVEDVYTRYHARKTWFVRIQELDVDPATAERVMRLAKTKGPVPQAFCARSTSEILSAVYPNAISQTFYPVQLSKQFAQLPGVKEQNLFEDDSDDNSKVLAEWDPAARTAAR